MRVDDTDYLRLLKVRVHGPHGEINDSAAELIKMFMGRKVSQLESLLDVSPAGEYLVKLHGTNNFSLFPLAHGLVGEEIMEGLLSERMAHDPKGFRVCGRAKGLYFIFVCAL